MNKHTILAVSISLFVFWSLVPESRAQDCDFQSNGVQQTFTTTYSAVPVQTSLCSFATPIYEGCSEYTATWYLPTKLTLPNQKFYQFTWSQNGTADLLRVDLPTGGSISYTYTSQAYQAMSSGDTNGGSCNSRSCSGATLLKYARRRVATRTVSVGGVSKTWTYTTAGVVTDPDGNDEVHVFVNNIGTLISRGGTYETQVRSYQGSSTSGTLLRTINKDYAAEGGPTDWNGYSYGAINVRAIRETTTLDNNLVSKVETDYETSQFSGAQYNYTYTRLNPLERREYAYGSSAAGPLVRRTVNTFLHTNNTTYQNLNITDRVNSTIVYDGSSGALASQTQYEFDNYTQPILVTGANSHDAAFSQSYVTRGNVTATKRWRNTDGVWLTTRNQYDDVGNVVSTTDPLNHTTSFDFTDAWSNATCAPSSGQDRRFVKTVTNALGQTTRYTHNSCTGTVATITDPNSQTTTKTYDLFSRLLNITYPDTGQSNSTYDDNQLLVTSSRRITAGASVYTRQHYDQLGRVVQSELCEDGTSACAASIKTDVTYDAVGRTATVSNPYRSTSDPTYGISTTQYDNLSRVTKLIPPDGTTSANNVSTSYSGNCATVTDQAGKARKSCSDALGRLTQVFEDPTGVNYETDYQYGALNDLTSVVQAGSRQRTFAYDSLSRLTSATNPESGIVTYAYDNNGNVHTKTDARGITTTYTYDVLNRLTLKSYSNGAIPNEYYYDGANHGYSVGHLTHASNDVNAAYDPTYDAMGRVISQSHCIPSDCSYNVTISATYDLAGDLTSLTYPSGRKVTFAVDGASRPTGATLDSMNGTNIGYNYLSSATYAPNGAPATMVLGNGLTETSTYNKRFQPLNQQVASSVITPLYRSVANWVTYDQDGQQINSDNITSGWHYRRVDMSQWAGKTISVLSLLTDSNTGAGTWQVIYGDIALLSLDGTVRPVYNGQSTLPAFSIWSSNPAGTSNVTYSDRHLSNIGWNPNTTTNYYSSDHLGSARMILSYWGYPTSSSTFLPFGQEWNSQLSVNHYKFTGKERDSESGLDEFGARYYSSAIGRFTIPDWADNATAVPYADFGNPQSLNLYSYVKNNPTTSGDPDGHDGITDVLAPAAPILIDVGISNPYGFVAAGGAVISIALAGQGREPASYVPGGMTDDKGNSVFSSQYRNSLKQQSTSNSPPQNEQQGNASTPDGGPDGPYKRPNNATTKEQRDSVQGKPCATCGATGQKNNADHKEPLVEEHYRTGKVDKDKMRSPDAVQPQCQSCSNI